MPDTLLPTPIEDDEAERLALEAAIAEARASGPGVPHAVVRERMLAMMAEARQRIATLEAAEQRTHRA